MPRTCSICNHMRRDEIDKALLAGESLRDIAGRVPVAKSALHRHKLHLSATLVKARDSEEIAHADGLLEQLRELTVEARHIKEKAEARKDYRTALAAVRELCRIVELVAKLRGEIDGRAEINVMNLQLDTETARRIGETFLSRHQLREAAP
jgi:hypothetical protein